MEIERKWLLSIDDIPYDLSAPENLELEQVYVCFSPSIRVRSMRDREGGEQYVLTVKGTCVDGGGLAREEFEMPIDRKAYLSLRAKGEGRPIRKTRYFVRRPDGLTEEIDIFHGELEGLAYLEIEFPTLEQARAFPSPAWTLRDVSADKRFRNSALARYGMPQMNRTEE